MVIKTSQEIVNDEWFIGFSDKQWIAADEVRKTIQSISDRYGKGIIKDVDEALIILSKELGL